MEPENISQLTVLDLGLNFQSPREDEQEEEQPDQNLMADPNLLGEEENPELYMDDEADEIKHQNIYMQGLMEDDEQLQHLLQYEPETQGYLMQADHRDATVMLMDPRQADLHRLQNIGMHQ